MISPHTQPDNRKYNDWRRSFYELSPMTGDRQPKFLLHKLKASSGMNRNADRNFFTQDNI